MSPIKIIMLITYAILAALAITMPGTGLGTGAAWVLLILAVAHLVEVAVFFKRCRAAGGSLPLHLLQVFLFGVAHMRELKE
ncbi:hypothetical protein EY643_11400 [Halioglobus maricola]|uniref:DUF1145 domain-containing protein n=1 Tax=Halioglobus maricola TaxID=2601894 RepID=A0A5P9NL44_9GAMM|nr:hypothetical protein [Halioglobus maricola]QFU76216.1 hypothetical protein EY643_11400 [Halioglobus maricola]